MFEALVARFDDWEITGEPGVGDAGCAGDRGVFPRPAAGVLGLRYAAG